METTLENGILTVRLSGRIDGNNADETAEKLSAACEGQECDCLYLDAEGLSYISSAGLRVLLKLKKTLDKPVHITNASDEVYDIFDMTGFTDIFTVHRVPHEISITGCKIIGRGTFGTVYRLDDERIVKVFNTDRVTSYERIEQEKRIAREAFVHDIPTAISYDVVRAGKYLGVVFERLEGDTLMSYLAEHPDERKEMVGRLCAILKKLHAAETNLSGLYRIKDLLIADIPAIVKPYFTDEQMERIVGIFADVPEQNTMVHGDFHPGNVMVEKDGELVLIDVGDISVGHPFFEFFNMYPSFLLNDEVEYGREMLNEQAKAFLGVETDEELAERKEFFSGYWNELLNAYFGEERAAEIVCHLDAIGRLKLLASFVTLPLPDEGQKRQEIGRIKQHYLKELEVVPPVNEWWVSK